MIQYVLFSPYGNEVPQLPQGFFSHFIGIHVVKHVDQTKDDSTCRLGINFECLKKISSCIICKTIVAPLMTSYRLNMRHCHDGKKRGNSKSWFDLFSAWYMQWSQWASVRNKLMELMHLQHNALC